MGHECSDDMRDEFGGDVPRVSGDECSGQAMPRRGSAARPAVRSAARVRPAALPRQAATRRAAAAGADTAPRPAAPDCARGRQGGWILPVVLGGAAVWAIALAIIL